jgi:hypothetical protein
MPRGTSKPQLTSLPTTMLEAAAINALVDVIDLFQHKLNSEEGRRVLRASIIEKFGIGAGARMQIIAAAERGDQDADWALRWLQVEYISRRQEMPTEFAAWAQRAALRAPLSSPPGRNIGDIWVRDLFIDNLVKWTMREFGVPRSRGRVSKNPDRLSANYLVSVALGRRGVNVNERGLEKITIGIVEQKLTERLSTFFQPV